MAREHQGFVIVISPAKVPMGIVTEWDLLAKVVAEGRDPSKVSLGEIMSTKLVSVDPSEGIDRVAQLMADEGTRRVLVVKDSQVLGVIRVRTLSVDIDSGRRRSRSRARPPGASPRVARPRG